MFKKLGIACAMLASAFSTVAFSQTPVNWLSIMTTRIKPEMRTEYEGYVKQISAAYKKAGVPFYVVHQNVAGDLNEYTSVVPVAKFADLDGPPAIQKVLGEENYGNLLASLRRCTVSQMRMYSRTLPELSIEKGPPNGTIWMWTNYAVNPGKNQEFNAYMKNEYKPAMEKAGTTHYLVSAPTFGGPVNQVSTIRMMKNLAEIDAGPFLIAKLGQEQAAALNSKMTPLARVASRRLIRVRTELSFLPAGPQRAGN